MRDGEILKGDVEGKIWNQFFSAWEMGRVENLRLEMYRVEEGEKDMVEWVREYLPLFVRLKKVVFMAIFKPGAVSSEYMYIPRGHLCQGRSWMLRSKSGSSIPS